MIGSTGLHLVCDTEIHNSHIRRTFPPYPKIELKHRENHAEYEIKEKKMRKKNEWSRTKLDVAVWLGIIQNLAQY